ncbi:ParM/StbA family protein (plasmid) [Parageobacillus toebii NBRC 107807]|jgi:plasmid segregation protein ParM|uniref:Plasmid segregation protein ParM n=1 Tax=Parageobacillus toebii NBRC 107807 TaxID=1223503 RepID=A0A6G9J8D8_9BACL|nr:ParM/StbA family protein [Parageobacillus toebii]MBB3870107.1 plasmid segregation protein ParM [Parageobacillus toebii NBRC 107807]QIQ34469.1 ParM/StbA family protein [Parageobacillus toebii NBRC 107807]
MKLVVANDIGNSETKMIVNDTLIKQPSVVKRLLSKPNVMETNVEKNIANLLDELIVHVTSNAIKRSGLYFIGKRANMTADKVENMNIKLGNKSKHDIPVLMTLSMLAARSVQLAYQENQELPPSISVDVSMTTAIPASEYSADQARYLEGRFTSNDHVVIVYVGETPVTVTLHFQTVKVTQEGIPALYALLESENEILKNYNEHYKKQAVPKDFANKRILHVDIGDGTTEYIYTVGMNPVTDVCSGEKRGVGHATEEATQLLKEEVGGFLNLNRQQFMDIFRDPSHNLHDLAVRFMQEARYSQAQRILEDIQEKYSDIAGNVDVIAVYGGGSIQFKEELYEELLDFANTVHCEVLWIPEKYAVDMNVNGLHVINEKILFKQHA